MAAPCFEYPVTEWDLKRVQHTSKKLIAEEPLSIRVEGNPYSVVMRTPGDELAHAAGFCLAEGLVDHPEDIAALGACDDGDTNVVTVTLATRLKTGGLTIYTFPERLTV